MTGLSTTFFVSKSVVFAFCSVKVELIIVSLKSQKLNYIAALLTRSNTARAIVAVFQQ